MVKVERNKISNTRRILKKNPNHFSFKATNEIATYLHQQAYYKSEFINKALSFYIKLINNPKEIMVELKKRNPELWKHINRRKFI